VAVNTISYLRNSQLRYFSHHQPLPEGECCEWPVRLVAVHVAHGRAPEVIAEHMAQRTESQHVLVLRHRRNVIVDEVSGQTVKVAAERHDAHDAIQLATVSVADLRFSRPCRPGEGSLG